MKRSFFRTTISTLRGRLTLWYILSTIIIFVLLAGLFSSLLWYSLHNQIDHHIHIVTGQAQQIAEDFQGAEREKLLKNLVSFEGMSIVILSQDGNELLQTSSKDIDQLQQSELMQLLEAGETYGHHPFHFTINDMRFGIADVTVEGQPALLAVGYSVSILRQTFYQMMLITLGVMTVTLIPFTFIGHRLLKKYLHPLEVIASTVQQVTQPRQLSMRITGLTLSEELKSITSSFNTMLSQLEKIFHTEHEFFSQAAHTLKTPLAVLRAKVEGLSKESQTNRQVMLNIIDDAVETIQDLLLISRIETGNEGLAKKINLSEIVEELFELGESLAYEKKVVVSKDIEDQVFFTADERLLKRALGNVVHNALEYTDLGGSVKLTLQETNRQVIFEVSNTGIGLSEQELPNVFDRFYRGANASQNEHGTGLGLAITKAVVEKYGGEIKLKSSKTMTKVRITFKNQTVL
jgi:signal transduction histidine kinase